jgi:hypothetical protein
MKKRMYIPKADSPSSSPAPSPTTKNPDLHTRPTASATSAKIEKPAAIPPEPQPERDMLQHRQEILARVVQHRPVPIGALGPTEYERCVCGFTLARYEGRTYWIRVRGRDDEPPICDVTDAEELAYALRTACHGSVNWKVLKQALREQKALKQQKSHQAPA